MDIVLLYTTIFVFLIAFAFSMVGQGGGSMYSPLLILLGYAVSISTSTSLVLTLITSLSAGYVFYRKKMIDFRTSFLFIPGVCLGAFMGGALVAFVDETFLLWLFVFFLAGLGGRMVYTFWERGKIEDEFPECIVTTMYPPIVLFSFGVGLISGLLGIGGGVLIVPFIIYICKHPTKFAAGSSHVIVSFSAFSGLLGYAAFRAFDIPLILVTGIAVLIGGNLGARTSMRIEAQKIRAGLGIAVWVIAVMILMRIF